MLANCALSGLMFARSQHVFRVPYAWGRMARAGAVVLVADDSAVNRMVAEATLRERGWDVDVVADGQQAVDAALAVPYDLVLMDCDMPVLDGLSATRRIREQETRRTRIVAMTASALVEDREACTAAGMDNYLSKPVRARELALLLADVPGPAALASRG